MSQIVNLRAEFSPLIEKYITTITEVKEKGDVKMRDKEREIEALVGEVKRCKSELTTLRRGEEGHP